MPRSTIFAICFLGILVLIAIILSSRGSSTIGDKVTTRVTPTAVTEQEKQASLPVLADHMPQFIGITKWWNTQDGQALTPEGLKGKVVLVDFWTYSCINCIRTYPFIKAMHEKYADKGLVIVGVHTPEFDFEGKEENVEKEIIKNQLKHPIALDAEHGTWQAYNNIYWPAEYFFDRKGQLRRTHFGEGGYDESEQAIRELLEESAGVELGVGIEMPTSQDFSKIKTPETYFGLQRGDSFIDRPAPSGQDKTFELAEIIPINKWTVSGIWQFQPEYTEARSTDATFKFNVQASQMHLVLESSDGTDKTIEVYIDGKKVNELKINASTLYTITDKLDGARKTIEIRIKDAGVRFYAATFS